VAVPQPFDQRVGIVTSRRRVGRSPVLKTYLHACMPVDTVRRLPNLQPTGLGELAVTPQPGRAFELLGHA
jgi:hypothetical protein